MIIKFAGKDYELKSLNMNDWIELEDNGFEVKKFQKGGEPSFKDMRLITWIALKKADAEIKLEYVGENIDPLKDAKIFGDIINFIVPKEKSPKKST